MFTPAAACPGATRTTCVAELARLNRLLAAHPCFFDGAVLTRLSQDDSPVYALRRDSAEGLDHLLVLVNLDERESRTVTLDAAQCAGLGPLQYDLLGQKPPECKTAGAQYYFCPGTVRRFLPGLRRPNPEGLSGDEYRRARAQSAWAIAALSKVLVARGNRPVRLARPGRPRPFRSPRFSRGASLS